RSYVSFIAFGIPCIGPVYFPSLIAPSAASASRRALSLRIVMNELMVGLSRSALWRTSSVNVTGEILPRMISGASVLIVFFIALNVALLPLLRLWPAFFAVERV